ncbi:MAG: hypothetical protein RIF33_23725 [Cyclobacteriaceae bacterium]
MERIVIVAYHPKAGKEAELISLARSHWSILDAQGLVSDRKPIISRAKDGSIVEVFGWKSEDSINQAHTNEVVQQLWAEFAQVCDYIPVGDVKEASQLFTELTPI